MPETARLESFSETHDFCPNVAETIIKQPEKKVAIMLSFEKAIELVVIRTFLSAVGH